MSIPLELRTLRVDDEMSFKSAVAAFAREAPSWEFAFDFDPAAPFADYVAKLDDWTRGRRIPDTWVPNTFFVGIVASVIVGRLSLRHRLNESLRREGGHIGYGVVPRYRNNGYATEMLRQALPHCARLGIERVLVTCNEDNLASQKAIERNGGRFEDYSGLSNPNERKRRYWIEVPRTFPPTNQL